MTSKAAQQAADKAAKLRALAAQRASGGQQPPAPDQAGPVVDEPATQDQAAPVTSPAPVTAAPRAAPIRSTVDLLPARHYGLKDWCAETAVQLGRSRVTTQDVVRALVARLLTDETLARKIRADLRSGAQ